MGPRAPEDEARGRRVYVRTSKCERCAGPATARKSRKESAAWQEKVQGKFKIRCARCKNFLKTEAEVAANQYDSKDAGERLCRACARNEKGGRNEKADAENRKRKAEADAKPLTCAACKGAFSDTKHLKQKQVEHHRAAKGAKLVCRSCEELGFTARSCQAYQCSGACKRGLPKSAFPDPHNVPRDAKKGTLKCKTCK